MRVFLSDFKLNKKELRAFTRAYNRVYTTTVDALKSSQYYMVDYLREAERGVPSIDYINRCFYMINKQLRHVKRFKKVNPILAAYYCSVQSTSLRHFIKTQYPKWSDKIDFNLEFHLKTVRYYLDSFYRVYTDIKGQRGKRRRSGTLAV